MAPPENFAYKVLVCVGKHLLSPFHVFYWHPGIIRSGRLSSQLTEAEGREVSVGIHVFHDAETAMKATGRAWCVFGFDPARCAIVRLSVSRRHLVCSGFWGPYLSSVYTEVENLGLYTGNA